MSLKLLSSVIQEGVREAMDSYLSSVGSDAKRSFGLFIKLPESIAEQFPHKPEEPSPPHVTFLYIGEGPEDEEEISEMIRILRDEISHMEPFKAVLDGIGYFKSINPEDGTICDRIVSHVKVRFEPEKRQWKGYLWTILEKAGIHVVDSFPNFQPHATLSFDYDKPHSFRYEGEIPHGEFQVEEIELWSGSGNEVETFKVGNG